MIVVYYYKYITTAHVIWEFNYAKECVCAFFSFELSSVFFFDNPPRLIETFVKSSIQPFSAENSYFSLCRFFSVFSYRVVLEFSMKVFRFNLFSSWNCYAYCFILFFFNCIWWSIILVFVKLFFIWIIYYVIMIQFFYYRIFLNLNAVYCWYLFYLSW